MEDHDHLERSNSNSNSIPFKLTYMHYNENLYHELLQQKIDLMKEKFYQFLNNYTDGSSNHLIDDVFIITSITRYRQRCRFAIEKVNDKLTYALYEYGSPSVYCTSYAIASDSINDIMKPLLDYLNDNMILHSRLKAITFLSSMQQEIVIALIYDESLSEEWKVAAVKMREHLLEMNLKYIKYISIVGRSKGEKVIFGNDYVYEQLELKEQTLRYKQMLDGFSNPNGYVNTKALDWICDTLQKIGKEFNLLELYCGNGNHTIALSKYFKNIVAVEINQNLVNAANENLQLNGISNVKVIQCDSGKFSKRILKKNIQEALTLFDCNDDNEMEFNVILVDPPRAGLDRFTLSLITTYNYIIYISCNPDNLIRDLSLIISTHDIVKLAVFDHFAYTKHLEAGIFLKMKSLHD